MAINYNRDGIIGINLPSQNNNYQNVAFKPGSLKDKLINQLYNIEQNTGFSNPKLDQLKQEDMQQFKDKGTPLSLPSDEYTAMKISNYDDLFGPQTFTDALGTTRTLSGLDRPDINTAPFNVNEGVTNTNSFRNMLLDDLRNLPNDLRTSLGQTKDALVEDFSGLGNFLKDKSIQGFDFAKQIPGMAISAISGVPLLGQGLLSLLGMLKGEDPEVTSMRNFYRNEYGLTDAGSLASGIMRGYNPVSGGLFGRPISYGLANAARDRINRIANRKAPQTAASRAKIQQLQDFARADTIKRARDLNPDVYEGRSGGFDTSAADRAGTSAGSGQGFSNKTGRGRTGY